MTSETIFIITAIILIFIVWSICLIHMYKKEHKRAEMLQEYIEIKKQIERGNKADKILWQYYDVTYLNGGYHIIIKGMKPELKTLEGGQKWKQKHKEK